MFKSSIIFGSMFAILSVVMGAFGAHALKNYLSDYSKSIYDKAVLYQIFHSIAILFSGILGQFINQDLAYSLWSFVLGIVLFSGSLYILAITGVKWWGAITPIGGSFFIIGWAILFYKALTSNI